MITITTKRLRMLFLCSILVILPGSFIHAQSHQSVNREADLAITALDQGEDAKALAYFKKSFQKGNQNWAHYRMAAEAATRLDNKDDAFQFLIRSISLGYMDEQETNEGYSFTSLRDDQRWALVTAEFKKQKEYIEQKFSQIQQANPTLLVPFQKDGLWGYLDKRTRKVVVDPVFRELNFMGDCTNLLYKDESWIRVSSKGQVIGMPTENVARIVDLNELEKEQQKQPQPVSSATGFKGFTVTVMNTIASFSDIYNRDKTNASANIEGPFRIDGKPYAIVHKETTSGIINEEGEPLPGFNFVHKWLARNPDAAGPTNWFYYVDAGNKHGFISEQGETRLAGELMNNAFLPTNKLYFGIQSNGKVWGVINTEKMEWTLAPQPRKIVKIDISYRGDCNIPPDKSGFRAVYFLVEDKSGLYFIDRDNIIYKPQ